jgi:hypothetical protein
MQIHTRTLSAGQSVTILAAWNVLQLSFVVNPGSTGTMIGDLTIGGTASSSVPLTANQGATISAQLPNSAIFGMTIACTAGTIDIIMGVQ